MIKSHIPEYLQNIYNIEPNVLMENFTPEIKKYYFEAHCVSTICNKIENYRNTKMGTIKNLKRFETYCPDCEHAVVWNKIEIKKENNK